jgi:hypothetical protein
MFSSEHAAYWEAQFAQFCAQRGITEAERELIWEAMAHRCYMQVLAHEGPFYETITPFLASRSMAEDYRQGEP